ncbi:MAG TPA: pyridoxamine 5'-phosphate oxidase family protein [Sedimentisphaerales bacterium]|nr:pyridoxamine 5'-phosphate oxidase family protein [Sedimentisphaerales bacterium]HRS10622.1 pyridoxamine 5'-phosphate oxidase family protein [Sedimentisphaerales bacterium]HRV47327.1 pyridoxamine 5'-phosphate oxidase family protein [Sedimentisphaerales bacterium]
MNLRDYFESTDGLGVLGTADAEGRVDMALYARPHVADDESVALIMSDRTSHNNIVVNPHAAYLFVESGKGYKGKRLYLTRTHEETDPARIDAVRRPGSRSHDRGDAPRFLVHFRVEEVRPLIGG